MNFAKNQLMNFDPNIEDQNVLHINRLPARATVVPAQRTGIYYKNKEESTLLRSLNGDYRFLYRLEDTEPLFYANDVEDSAWDVIDVPSMWQYRGYGKPEYPNIRYPIPALPPYVKKQNPVGYYRKRFVIEEPSEKTILHFGGVDNAFYVYLNGTMVGFSKGSRLPAEFDVTGFIKKGENLLAIKVFTYSDATYLENQDMLLASGIFRDVYLIESRADTLWDYRVRTTYSSISIEATLEGCGNYDVRISLDGQSVTYKASKYITHTFELDEPRLWSAETPQLYDLTIELLRNGEAFEVHSKRVGIMHSRIEGNKFLVNERPIYIKGINRHENNAKNGRAISVEEIEADLKLIKENNLNAIRLAHYTNHPATYEIAAELGLYLMDEADLETHGAYIINGDQGYLSKTPEWLPAYKDRIIRMLETNKNEVAIFIWSTGNEAGTGENLDRCIDIIREFDPNHECIITQDTGVYTHFRKIAYYPMSRVNDYTDEGYPVLAIEYAHAMGNSPGTLEDYWDYNYTHEKMVGGFAWEFRNHGFYSEDEDGNAFYKYGGDFDDRYHWANFNMDGFCMSDGTPKPTWYELGAVSFAAYTTFDGHLLHVKNTNDFLTLSYLTAKYDITAEGEVVKQGSFDIPEVMPHESFSVKLDLSVTDAKAGVKYFLNVHYFDNDKKVHTKQFELGVLKKAEPFVPKAFERSVSVDNYILKVLGKDFSVQFTKGMLSHFEKDGKLLIERPMSLNFWRAHTDNDGISIHSARPLNVWKREMIRDYYFNLYDINVEEKPESVTVTTIGRMTTDSVYGGFICKVIYEIYEGGNILVSLRGEPYGTLPENLPRIGVIFGMDKSFDSCSWIGRGPGENYSDSNLTAPVGSYSFPVEGMNVIYDYPQETGNHENTTLVSLESNDGRKLFVVGSDEFSFSYHDFSLDDLENALHKNELKKSTDANYLYVDYKMRGLGSRSCGPDPEEKSELRPHSFELSFILCGDGNVAQELSHLDFSRKTRALSDTYVATPTKRIPQLADCDI